MMDEELLDRLDADQEVRQLGRSSVFRRIVAQYLEDRRRKTIASEYRLAYGAGAEGLGKQFSGWEREGRWPNE